MSVCWRVADTKDPRLWAFTQLALRRHAVAGMLSRRSLVEGSVGGYFSL
jgi:hypothetical protein